MDNKASIVAELIKLADKYDAEGQYELAAEVDQTLKSLASGVPAFEELTVEAARPKAPLKHLDPKTRKDLLIFLRDAQKEITTAQKHVEEFFARLRYLNDHEKVEEIGLDGVVSDLGKSGDCLCGAIKKFYELTSGRKPGKNDIDTLIGDDEAQARDDFFASRSKPAEQIKETEDTVEENTEDKEPCCDSCTTECDGTCYCHDKLDEKDLQGFWTEDESNDNPGRISPNGVAITNGTGGEGKDE